MQKNTFKKSHVSIRILVLLFLGSLAYAIYDFYGPFELKKEVVTEKNKIPKYFDYGIISDSTYCNDFFSFRIPIPNGYEGKYKAYDYITKDIYTRDSLPATPKLISNITDHNLLIIEPVFVKIDPVKMILEEKKDITFISEYLSKKNQRDTFGADYQMVIRVHRLQNASIQSYINQFKNLHNPNYGGPKTKMVSGIAFKELQGVDHNGEDVPGRVMYQMLGGKDKNIISLNTVIHDFAFSIDLFYQTEEQKSILLEMVNSMKFHS